MDEFKQLAVRRAVEKLFSDRSFCIIELDEIAEMLGVKVNQTIRQQLRAYHCVKYSTMSDREKQLIQEKVVECLRGDQILNPARVMNQLLDEGGDFTFTEDRYIDGQAKRLS